ncbi:peptidoglycan recognition family protein [Streptomyces sp. NPDC012950]|uniref:peptidoglycan recognition protein family protein n=1 Tax=Streptomyces sp. NPDC012950 TaxID=3364858 RepID=UPI0036AE3319
MAIIRRAQYGLPATSPAAYIAKTRGVKVHYLGTPYSSRPHSQCAAYVRSIRASHLANTKENYSDIAYNHLVCEHGDVYEGRGPHHRTGANGNATLNSQDYAVCALLGSSGLTEPTDAMLHGIRDAIEDLRRNGDAGDWIGGHRDGHPTSCPGDPLYAWVRRGAPRPGTAPTTPTEEDDMTPDQAKQLKELHDAFLPYMGWDYKGKGKADAWALLNNLTTQVTAQTAAIKALAGQLGDDVDTAAVVAAVEKAIAKAVVQVNVDVTGPTNS